jgi:pimeloyl-ACP methyl ester carboxylesterase
MAAATEHRIKLTHGETRYYDGGAGDPTIFIHGVGFNAGADGWLQVMEPMSERLRVISIDCLNWGPGDVFNDEFSFAYLVDHVREIMDGLGLDRANIVGHSMGGWLATLFAYESPERVNKLVLVAAGGTATRPLQSMVEFKPPTDEVIREQVGKRLASIEIDAEPIVESYVERVHDPEKVEAYSKVMKHMSAPLTRQQYNTLRRLPHIKAPTLVLWGRNDQTNDVSLGEQIHAGIKGSKLVVLEETGHMLPQERPNEFVKEVLAFLG